MRGIFYIILFFLLIGDNYALESVVVKLDPDYVKSDGDPVYLNISVENIPPRGSLGMPSIYTDPEIVDGGCLGVDIYVNYSDEYLKPVRFRWNDEFKDVKIKEYKFENRSFYLSISFQNPKEGSIYLGTLIFNPIKKGETKLNISGVVSSEWGVEYSKKNKYYIDYGKESQCINYYPDTEYYGATVVIEEEGNYTNQSTKLEEILDGDNIPDGGNLEYRGEVVHRIINNITVITNQDIPEVIVEEINISEGIPNITVIVNTSEVLDHRLLIYIFIGSLLSGIIFGIIMRLIGII